MGYISNVLFVLNAKGTQAMLDKLDELDEPTKEAVNQFLNEEADIHKEHAGYHLYKWTRKWYVGDESRYFIGVNFVDRLMNYYIVSHRDYLFIRIGEDYDDIVIAGSMWENPFNVGIQRSLEFTIPDERDSYGEPVFNHTAHKELWNWLSENPTEKKESWPGWENHKRVLFDSAGCFACDYDDKFGTNIRCHCCPLVWPSGGRCVTGGEYCVSGARVSGTFELFGLWRYHSEMFGANANSTLLADLARKIRDLPVREGVKCI